MDERTVKVGIQGVKILSKLFNKYDPEEVLKKCPLPECKGRSVSGVVVEESSPRTEAGYPRQRSEESVIDLPTLTQLLTPQSNSVGTTPRVSEESPPMVSKVTDKETLLYQLQHLHTPLVQLELHLAEGCIIMGKRCDCCRKHAGQAKLFAQETIPIAARQGEDFRIYNEIINWAIKVENIPISVPNEVLQMESGPAGLFRKRVEGMIEDLKRRM